MAKVKHCNALDQHGQLEQIYAVDTLELVLESTTRGVYVDDDGDKIIFNGSNLSFNGEVIVSGRLNGFKFVDSDGDTLISVTNGDWIAKALYNALAGPNEIRGLLTASYASKDQFQGSDKGDIIYGAGGNDRLTGGKGEDWFLFGHGDGRDVVTDFDAVGGTGKQDFVRQFSNDFHMRRSGEDTIVDFGNGDTLILLDVKRSDVTLDDFMIF
ncbi:hypothetical protein JJB09_12465 [Rhizobium sp. KVB221]|uniref:Calcium-binding protein n=1 Tax=Rhizobium setariae TaxID=2801340 RepID=A0A936YNP2_9HYPH|nr:hypothetical protein [Rhizobium setariae]MBL0372843.1 hypothetical protein [Rhizobium setariae]